MYEAYYLYIDPRIKANAFDVLSIFSSNRHQFDGLHFTAAFCKLYDMCEPLLNLDEDALSQAVDTVLTLEQRRMNSYSQGNTHIEDYVPAHVKDWREYLK